MGVLIKGMAMPPNCDACPMLYEYRFCSLTGDHASGIWWETEKARMPNCPLEEVQEPKRGKWGTKFTPTECNPFGDYPVLIMRCSACKTKITLMHEDENIKEKWNYCPNCGARMERANDFGD
jgi:DNA-directed RNA polymerase subunit RPC12/RpoP